ncbi:hypothetical protein E2C01_004795 [Portunus trituberculatus]|uniref:Uncharacterized protein n=1 Tax=Portunus trituberculatus TaxID=210409 RepID=A0A5B7CQL8_PORTR|nr:hypothetical protein [Portunus trituberculatus]
MQNMKGAFTPHGSVQVVLLTPVTRSLAASRPYLQLLLDPTGECDLPYRLGCDACPLPHLHHPDTHHCAFA